MPNSLTTESKPTCREAGGQFSSCGGESLYEHETKHYCVLHLPSQEKGAEFDQELRRKLESKNFNFPRVWFPRTVSFSEIIFEDDAIFYGATFNGDADFTNAKFRALANFGSVTFKGKAVFEGAVFSAVGQERDKEFPHLPVIPVVEFRDAKFLKSVNFNATFSGPVSFHRSVFGSKEVTEPDEVPEWARVKDFMQFASATFSAPTDFEFATFNADTALGTTFGKVSFRGAKFNSNVFFEKAHFSGETDFSKAVFSTDREVSFKETKFPIGVNFSDAKFKGKASFIWARFGKETPEAVVDAESKEADEEEAKIIFTSATFGQVEFQDCYFYESVNFTSATFDAPTKFWVARFRANAIFDSATFKGETTFDCPFSAMASFSGAKFQQLVTFTGTQEREIKAEAFGRQQIVTSEPTLTKESFLNLRSARLEESARLCFRSVVLRPHWFVDIDASSFEFINVRWEWDITDEEIRQIENKAIASPYRLLAIACWNLAVNAEENHRYEEASSFRYMAMDARRLEWYAEPFRARELRRFGLLHQLYWLASGYGERIARASVVLLGLWLACAGMYTLVGFSPSEPKPTNQGPATNSSVNTSLDFRRALTYSAGVLTFQKPEPKPATTAAQTVVLLETILGPVQAALLALAIRRKFMR